MNFEPNEQEREAVRDFVLQKGKDFYKTYRWKAFRRAVLRKKKRRCELCWQGGADKKGIRRFVRASMLHHKQHLKDRPDLALSESNMEALCRRCHEIRHPERLAAWEKSRKRGQRERWD